MLAVRKLLFCSNAPNRLVTDHNTDNIIEIAIIFPIVVILV